MPEYYTTEQIAEMLGMARGTIRRWRANGLLKTSYTSRGNRVTRENLCEFLTEVLKIEPQPKLGLDAVNVIENERYFTRKEVMIISIISERTFDRRFDSRVFKGFRFPDGKRNGNRRVSSASLLGFLITTELYKYYVENNPEILRKYGFPVVKR